MRNFLRTQIYLVMLLIPHEAVARGGRGSDNEGSIMLGLAVVFAMGWGISKIKSDTWRIIGGILVILFGVTFVIQIVTALLR